MMCQRTFARQYQSHASATTTSRIQEPKIPSCYDGLVVSQWSCVYAKAKCFDSSFHSTCAVAGGQIKKRRYMAVFRPESFHATLLGGRPSRPCSRCHHRRRWETCRGTKGRYGERSQKYVRSSAQPFWPMMLVLAITRCSLDLTQPPDTDPSFSCRIEHAFDNYMRLAFPHDELKPISQTYTDSLGVLRVSRPSYCLSTDCITGELLNGVNMTFSIVCCCLQRAVSLQADKCSTVAQGSWEM